MADTPEDPVPAPVVEADPVPAPADDKALPVEEPEEPPYPGGDDVEASLPPVDMLEGPPGLPPLPYVGIDCVVDDASDFVVAKLEAVLLLPETEDVAAEPLGEDAPVGPDDSPELPPVDVADEVEPEPLPELESDDDDKPLTIDVGFP